MIKFSKEKLKIREGGITLVALVVTIVVLLILAGITMVYIFSDNGIIKLAQDAKDKTEEAIRNEQGDFANLQNYMNEAINNWTQDKTVVTNGTITLEVGQAVKGYTANGVGDGNWYVLGAKDGKLLITTGSNQGTVTLEGQDGYVNGITKLNTEGAKYKDTDMAESARSIDVEDINRVTGYDPDVAKYNDGKSQANQWGNKVTYTLSSDGKIHGQGTKYPTTDTASSETSFIYWDGNNWVTLIEGESKTITHDFYVYYPETLSYSYVDDAPIKRTKAYALLFANTFEDESTYYWLANQYFDLGHECCYFGIRTVWLRLREWGRQVSL